MGIVIILSFLFICKLKIVLTLEENTFGCDSSVDIEAHYMPDSQCFILGRKRFVFLHNIETGSGTSNQCVTRKIVLGIK